MKKLINYSSPWAFLLSFSLMSTMLSLCVLLKLSEFLNKFSFISMITAFSLVLMCMFYWMRDSTRESMSGNNNNDISSNMKLAVVLFLISESFFFVSFFWMFLYSAIAPESGYWPPVSLQAPTFIGAPSLNTILLVTSSLATVTMSHFETNYKGSWSIQWLLLTLLLSALFITVQWMEYTSLPFNFTSSNSGAVFFISTGFHGLHVIIGTLALVVSFMFLLNLYFTNMSMMGFELTIWYWHFVDAIWLMLYVMFYCWGH
uniref:Cytochrome c oxidase subunit 3 n=1 Tax=Eucoleus annulatus TaxID=2831232 RepID=A0A8E8HT36_9BILA|nr:cytochrome c oxidase subunit III [Eucoleus annulatus]QWC93304.1 cytochrome c oxidase subunit III [Eucoleus annulatus]